MKQKIARLYKILLSVVIIIPLIGFLGFVGAISFIDFNRYKPQIEAEITQMTGRTFKIEGAVDVSALPFSLNIGQSTLNNPKGFHNDTPQLRFENLHIELSALALFVDQKIAIQNLTVRQPVVSLLRNSTGEDNWSDLPGVSHWLSQQSSMNELMMHTQNRILLDTAQMQPMLSLSSAAQANVAAAQPDDGVANLTISRSDKFNWHFESLVIEQGQLQLLDAQQEFDAKISELNIVAIDVNPTQAFEARSDFIYHHSLSPRYFKTRLNTVIEQGSTLLEWRLTDAKGVVRVQVADNTQVPEVHFGMKTNSLYLDLNSRKIGIKQMQLEGLDGQADVSFSGKIGADANFSGVLAANQLNFDTWSQHLGIQLPELKRMPAQKHTQSGEFNWKWDAQGMRLAPITKTN